MNSTTEQAALPHASCKKIKKIKILANITGNWVPNTCINVWAVLVGMGLLRALSRQNGAWQALAKCMEPGTGDTEVLVCHPVF